jgi:hypothetical protein
LGDRTRINNSLRGIGMIVTAEPARLSSPEQVSV